MTAPHESRVSLDGADGADGGDTDAVRGRAADQAGVPAEPAPIVPPSLEKVEETEGVLSRSYRMLTLGIVACVLLIAFEATAVATAMPVAADRLHGLSLYAFAFSAFFTGSLFAMVVSGEWCDRSGPAAPLFAGIACFTVGLVVSGTAQEMWTFLLGRGVQGMGGGLIIVALYVIVGRAYPERLRPAVMAAVSSAWVVPAIVGPLIAGAVTEHLGWRWLFLAIPVLVLIPLPAVLTALPKISGPQTGQQPKAVDRRRILLALAVAVGAGVLQYAGQERSWPAVVPAVLGAGLLVPCVVRLLPAGTFRLGRGLPSVVLLRGVAAGSFTAAESFVPLLLVSQRGVSLTLAGLSLAGGGLTWALGSIVQSHPRAQPHRHALIKLGMVLMALSIAGAAAVLSPTAPVWVVAVSWTVAGFGMGLVIPSVGVLLLKLSRPQDAGHNSASLQVSDALGNVVLVGLCGVVFATLGGGSIAVSEAATATDPGNPGAFATVLLSMAVVALAGLGVAARLRPTGQQ